MDTSASVTEKRGRVPVDVAANLDGPLWNQEKRGRVGDPRLATVADKEVVKEHAQWRNPELKSRLDAAQASVVGGVCAATSAEECHRTWGRELTEEEGKLQRGLASVAKERELSAQKKFKAFKPAKEGALA